MTDTELVERLEWLAGVSWKNRSIAYRRVSYQEAATALKAAEAENAKLREALEFYGDTSHWTDYKREQDDPTSAAVGDRINSIQADGGRIARAALSNEGDG